MTNDEIREALENQRVLDDLFSTRANQCAILEELLILRAQRTPATATQPAPTGEGPEVWADLIENLERQIPALRDMGPGTAAVAAALLEDFRARDRVGRERYGMPLRAFNGRDALTDAYQEALDLLAYLQQAGLEGQAPGRLAQLLDAAAGIALSLRGLLTERERNAS